jgi:O-antigen ligase
MLVRLAVLAYRMQARKQIIAAGLVLLALSAAVPEWFYDRIGRVVAGDDATGAGRTEIWKLGLDALGDFWLFGAGLHNFPEVFKQYSLTGQGGYGAHNSYLAVTVELGVIGLALMLAAVASHFLAVWRARRAGHGGLALAATEAAAFGMLSGAMFGDRVWTKTIWLTWTLLTWAIYCERRPSETPRAPVSEHASERRWIRSA